MTTVESLRCGWSFERLDPAHPDPQKRTFVACSVCQRPYIAANWPGKCTRQECNGTESKPLQVPSNQPEPEPVRLRVALPFCSGPLNNLSDRPLGISEGTLFFPEGCSHQIQFRNNSDKTITIPRFWGPVWVSIVFERDPVSHQSATMESEIHLTPGDTVTATIHAHSLRPSWSDEFYPLHGGQGLQLVTSQDRRIVQLLQFVEFFFAVVHVVGFWRLTIAPGWVTALSASISGGLLVAIGLFLNPRILLRLQPLPRIRDIPVELIHIAFAGKSVFQRGCLRLLLVFAFAFCIIVFLTPVMLLIGEMSQTIPPILACSIYGSAILVFTALWHSKCGNSWLPAAWTWPRPAPKNEKSAGSDA